MSITAGELANDTGEVILVYGPKISGAYDNSLYFLPTGRKTPSGWDCDGLYVSNDRIVSQALLPDKHGPVAVKYIDLQTPTITLSGNKYQCPFNRGVYSPGELNWEIPNISRSNIPGNYPEVPNHEPVD